MRYGRVFFIFVVLLCGFETVRLWSLSPDVMAVHFNALGNPDRFVPRFEFFSDEVKTVFVVIVLGLVVQLLPMILPVEWINMPNREYWLSPERREATIDRFSYFGAALFALILVVIQAVFELAVSANLHEPIVFAAPIMVPIIIGLIIVSFIMLFRLSRSFRLPS
jgi:hypothetical protein